MVSRASLPDIAMEIIAHVAHSHPTPQGSAGRSPRHAADRVAPLHQCTGYLHSIALPDILLNIYLEKNELSDES